MEDVEQMAESTGNGGRINGSPDTSTGIVDQFTYQ